MRRYIIGNSLHCLHCLQVTNGRLDKRLLPDKPQFPNIDWDGAALNICALYKVSREEVTRPDK